MWPRRFIMKCSPVANVIIILFLLFATKYLYCTNVYIYFSIKMAGKELLWHKPYCHAYKVCFIKFVEKSFLLSLITFSSNILIIVCFKSYQTSHQQRQHYLAVFLPFIFKIAITALNTLISLWILLCCIMLIRNKTAAKREQLKRTCY